MMMYVVIALVAFIASVSADPCAPETKPTTCGNSGMTCTDDNDCCDGLGCFGFNFFKRCQPPPTCMPEYYDCSMGIRCCGELVCSETKSGKSECQKEKIGTKPVFLPGKSNLIQTEAPSAAPKVKNLKTTTIPGAKLVTKTACATGDPHITTFDGLQYDAQTHGEHILIKSPITQREVQGRFTQLLGRTVAVVRGVVIQDEGDTPKVQITMPLVNEGISHRLGDKNCSVQLFVDGVQQDLLKYNGTSKVSITLSKNLTASNAAITVLYKVSGFKSVITMGFWNGCLLNTCFTVPSTDPVIGMLGSADGNATNDWMARNGTIISYPTDKVARNRLPAYDYVSKNWCIRKESESLFTYNQMGLDFQDFQRCDLKYGSHLDEDIAALITPAIATACKQDLECLLDATLGGAGGVAAAQQAVAVKQAVAATCNNAGGECVTSACCTGFSCQDLGIAGKQCVAGTTATKPVCMPELGTCDVTPCCDGQQCVTTQSGSKLCQPIPPVCQAEHMSCAKDADCCTGMTCAGPDGEMSCRKLTTLKNGVKCLPLNDGCGFGLDCCPGSQCVNDFVAGHRCLALPTCWNEAMRPCDDIEGLPKCCDGFECVERKGRNVCSPLPTCSTKWLSCDKIPCCESDGTNPLQCVTTPSGKMCQPIRNNGTK